MIRLHPYVPWGALALGGAVFLVSATATLAGTRVDTSTPWAEEPPAKAPPRYSVDVRPEKNPFARYTPPANRSYVPPPPAPDPPDTDGLVLVGTIGNGTDSVAYIRDTRAGSTSEYRQGSLVRNAVVIEVTADFVVVEREGLTRRLDLFDTSRTAGAGRREERGRGRGRGGEGGGEGGERRGGPPEARELFERWRESGRDPREIRGRIRDMLGQGMSFDEVRETLEREIEQQGR
jgi:hypothetical protein